MPEKTHALLRLPRLLVAIGQRLGLLVLERNQSGFAPFLEPVTLAANIDGGGVMEQPVEDGGGDDRVAEDRTPFAITLVGCEDDASPVRSVR